jgi:esterase/lipase
MALGVREASACVAGAQDGYVFTPARGATVVPSVAALDAVSARIRAHVASRRGLPYLPAGADRDRAEGGPYRREDEAMPGRYPESYCLFHAAGVPVTGTVLLFHGFNNRPHQQAKLASYLFATGFNVYNVLLSGHDALPARDAWPKLLYRKRILDAVEARLRDDPSLRRDFLELLADFGSGRAVPRERVHRTVDALLPPPYTAEVLLEILEKPGARDFRELVEEGTGWNAYLVEARARLDELSAMPGPIFLAGLSVGATVALELAAEDGGRRVSGVVASAPYLRSASTELRERLLLLGPVGDRLDAVLGLRDFNTSKFTAASPRFPNAAATAHHALGSYLRGEERVRGLAKVPVLFVLTEADDSADNALTRSLVDRLRDGPAPQVLSYPRAYAVAHALVDPEDYPDLEIPADRGGGRNRFWKSLYQEHLRFFSSGRADEINFLRGGEGDPSLPRVLP